MFNKFIYFGEIAALITIITYQLCQQKPQNVIENVFHLIGCEEKHGLAG